MAVAVVAAVITT